MCSSDLSPYQAYDLALDSAGTLYVASINSYLQCSTCRPGPQGHITEYPKGYTTGPPAVTITVDYPTGMAFDSSGNLYVANCEICYTGIPGNAPDQILVFAPGGTVPIRTITANLNGALGVALDANNTLYVENCINCYVGGEQDIPPGSDTITEYSSFATGSNYLRTITFASQPDIPTGLAFDSSNNLYVGNFGPNTVTEYAPGTTTPSKTISTGINEPTGLAFDKQGTLYVSNFAGTVTEYPAGYTTGNPSATLTASNATWVVIH